MEDRITPIRFKSKREVKRLAKIGATNLDGMYHLKVSKRRETAISPFISFVPAR